MYAGSTGTPTSADSRSGSPGSWAEPPVTTTRRSCAEPGWLR